MTDMKVTIEMMELCIFILNWATTFLGTFDFGRLVTLLHDIKYSIKRSLYFGTTVQC